MTKGKCVFDHEKLDVYRVSIDFIVWIDGLLLALESRHHNVREQLDRASQAISLNIAEGNGKRVGKDRRRFFEIARGSAMECAAGLDVLVAKRGATEEITVHGKEMLFRVVSMLTKLAPPFPITRTRTKNENENTAERSSYDP